MGCVVGYVVTGSSVFFYFFSECTFWISDTDSNPPPTKVIWKGRKVPQHSHCKRTLFLPLVMLFHSEQPSYMHLYRKCEYIGLDIKVLTVKMSRKESRTWYLIQHNRKLTVMHFFTPILIFFFRKRSGKLTGFVLF